MEDDYPQGLCVCVCLSVSVILDTAVLQLTRSTWTTWPTWSTRFTSRSPWVFKTWDLFLFKVCDHNELNILGIYPTYFLHYEQENGRRIFLLAGRKRKKCSTSTYVLSTDPTDLSRQGNSTLATVRWDNRCLERI